MKKSKGEVQQFFVQMICILFSFAILLYAIYFLKSTVAYNDVNQIARKYILKMERKGFLTSNEINDIKSELKENKNINKENISINVSNVDEKNKAPFGEDISIEISCDIKIKSFDLSDSKFTKSENEETVTIKKSSTARW